MRNSRSLEIATAISVIMISKTKWTPKSNLPVAARLGYKSCCFAVLLADSTHQTLSIAHDVILPPPRKSQSM